jgi:hypothetical protein
MSILVVPQIESMDDSLLYFESIFALLIPMLIVVHLFGDLLLL